MGKYRLAVLAVLPIPYQIPIWSRLGKHPDIDLTVYYCQGYFKGWEIPLMDGYTYKFLPNLVAQRNRGYTRLINPGIVSEIVRQRYDAIVIHGYDTVSAWLGLLTARAAGTPILFRGESVLSSQTGRFRQAVKKVLLSWIMNNAAIVFYSCTGNRRYYEYYGAPAEKMRLIPVAVDNERFQAEYREWSAQRAALRDEYHIPNDHFVVISIAQFRPEKRVIDILQAQRILQEQNVQDVSILLVGDGPERPNLEAFIQEHQLRNVHLAGFQDHATISKFYAIADVGVIVSAYDPSPKALNEMLNFALPVIGTEVIGSVPDLIHDGENGYIIPLGDFQSLAAHLMTLSRDRDLARRMGQKSLEVVSHWDMDSDVQAIVGAVREVAG